MCDCSAHNGFLTAKGLEEAAQRVSIEGLAPLGVREYIDKQVSVSGLTRHDINMDFHEELIDEQHRRFLQVPAGR